MIEVPFSRPVKVEHLPRDGLTQSIEANAEERAALAKWHTLPDVAALRAHFVIKKSGKGVRITGEVHAEVTRVCVVSLEPFPVEIEEDVDVKFAPAAEDRPARAELDVTLEDLDDPDPLIDGIVDLGALASEFMALALDPYPRKPGVEFASPLEDEPQPSPFDALGGLAKSDK